MNLYSIGRNLAFFFLLAMTVNLAQGSVMDRQSYTFAPEVEVRGPVLNAVSEKEYNKQVLKIILKESHELAKEYSDAEDYQGYWAFILGGLTVPFHEGGNMHFRVVENNGSKCLERSNSGRILRVSNAYVQAFTRIFKQEDGPVIPNCDDIEHLENFTQMLHGGDGSDIGIMQVNIRWHEKNYLAVDGYKSVKDSVRYGLRHFKYGLDQLYQNPNRHSCVKTNGRVDQKKLLRSAWAGNYNSGNLSASCRWTDSSSPWAANDRHFLKNIEAIYGLSEIANIDTYYSLPSKETGLLQKIILAVKNPPASNRLITSYLENESVEDVDLPAQRNGQSPRQVQARAQSVNKQKLVTATNLIFRNAPSMEGDVCGTLPQGENVAVTKEYSDNWNELQETARLNALSDTGLCRPGDSFFAYGSYLSALPENGEESAVRSGRTTTWLHVRAGAPEGYTLASKTGNVLSPGDRVLIAGEEQSWFHITSPFEGWVSSDFIELE